MSYKLLLFLMLCFAMSINENAFAGENEVTAPGEEAVEEYWTKEPIDGARIAKELVVGYLTGGLTIFVPYAGVFLSPLGAAQGVYWVGRGGDEASFAATVQGSYIGAACWWGMEILLLNMVSEPATLDELITVMLITLPLYPLFKSAGATIGLELTRRARSSAEGTASIGYRRHSFASIKLPREHRYHLQKGETVMIFPLVRIPF